MFFHIVLRKPLKDIPSIQNTFTATPLFLRDDVSAFKYFNTFTDEIDQITGPAITVFLAEQVELGSADGVARLFDKSSAESKRFPNIKRGDLPCIWIEDKDGMHSIIKINDDENSAKQIIRF